MYMVIIIVYKSMYVQGDDERRITMSTTKR